MGEKNGRGCINRATSTSLTKMIGKLYNVQTHASTQGCRYLEGKSKTFFPLTNHRQMRLAPFFLVGRVKPPRSFLVQRHIAKFLSHYQSDVFPSRIESIFFFCDRRKKTDANKSTDLQRTSPAPIIMQTTHYIRVQQFTLSRYTSHPCPLAQRLAKHETPNLATLKGSICADIRQCPQQLFALEVIAVLQQLLPRHPRVVLQFRLE